MKVKNLISSSGNPVANQFEIIGDDGRRSFQSYSTLIIKEQGGGKPGLISVCWEVSKTTMKYTAKFLGVKNAAAVRKLIKAGYLIEVDDINNYEGDEQ